MREKEKLTELAYKHIFNGLLSGKYRAGQNLDIDGLSEGLNMSKTPIREALVELEGEGLIYRSGRFYYVISLSQNEIEDMYEVRKVLEAEAAALAATRASPEIIQDLTEVIEKIAAMSKEERPDPIALADLNGKFHSLISLGSGNKFISKIISDIRLRLKIVRVTLFASYNRRMEEVNEHTRVFEAIKKRDPELARREMIDHQNNVISFLKREILPNFYY